MMTIMSLPSNIGPKPEHHGKLASSTSFPKIGSALSLLVLCVAHFSPHWIRYIYNRLICFIHILFLGRPDNCGNRVTHHRSETGRREELQLGWKVPVINEWASYERSSTFPSQAPTSFLVLLFLHCTGSCRISLVCSWTESV